MKKERKNRNPKSIFISVPLSSPNKKFFVPLEKKNYTKKNRSPFHFREAISKLYHETKQAYSSKGKIRQLHYRKGENHVACYQPLSHFMECMKVWMVLHSIQYFEYNFHLTSMIYLHPGSWHPGWNHLNLSLSPPEIGEGQSKKKDAFLQLGDSCRNGNTSHAGTLKIENCQLYLFRTFKK